MFGTTSANEKGSDSLAEIFFLKACTQMNDAVADSLVEALGFHNEITVRDLNKGISLYELEGQLNRQYFSTRETMLASISSQNEPRSDLSHFRSRLEEECAHMNKNMGKRYTNIANAAMDKIRNIIFHECEQTLIDSIQSKGPYDATTMKKIVSLQNESCSEMFGKALGTWTVPDSTYESIRRDVLEFQKTLSSVADRENASRGKRSSASAAGDKKKARTSTPASVAVAASNESSSVQAQRDRAREWAKSLGNGAGGGVVAAVAAKASAKKTTPRKSPGFVAQEEEDDVEILDMVVPVKRCPIEAAIAHTRELERQRKDEVAKLVKEGGRGKR